MRLIEFNKLVAPFSCFSTTDYLITLHRSFKFLGFASEEAIWCHLTSSRLDVGYGRWVQVSGTLIWLGTKILTVYSCVWGRCLGGAPVSRAFPPQHHATWPLGETCPHHDAGTSRLHSLHCAPGLEFRVWWLSHKPSPRFSSVYKMFLHFSLGQWLKLHPLLLHMTIFQQRNAAEDSWRLMSFTQTSSSCLRTSRNFQTVFDHPAADLWLRFFSTF